MLNPINLFQPIHIPKIHWASPQVLQLRPVELPALKPNQVRVKASHVGLAVGNFGTCFGHMFCRQTVESLWRFDDQNGFMLGEPVGISRTNIYNIINIIIYRCICIYIYISYINILEFMPWSIRFFFLPRWKLLGWTPRTPTCAWAWRAPMLRCRTCCRDLASFSWLLGKHIYIYII